MGMQSQNSAALLGAVIETRASVNNSTWRPVETGEHMGNTFLNLKIRGRDGSYPRGRAVS